MSSKSGPAIAIIGLGHGGIPLAVALPCKYKVVTFDVSSRAANGLKARLIPQVKSRPKSKDPLDTFRGYYPT